MGMGYQGLLLKKLEKFKGYINDLRVELPADQYIASAEKVINQFLTEYAGMIGNTIVILMWLGGITVDDLARETGIKIDRLIAIMRGAAMPHVTFGEIRKMALRCFPDISPYGLMSGDCIIELFPEEKGGVTKGVE